MRKGLSAVLLAIILCSLPAVSSASNQAYYQRALEHYVAGEFDKAITLMKLYVGDRPDPGAYYLIGYSYYKLGKHDEANKYFEYAFLIDPEYSPTPELIEAGKLPPKPPKAVVKKRAEALKPSVKPAAKAAASQAEAKKAAPKKAGQPKVIPPAAVNAPTAVTNASAAVNAPAAAPKLRKLTDIAAPEAEKGMPWGDLLKMDFSKVDFTALLAPVGGALAVYLLLSLFLFKVAKKRGVGRVWLAWVPALQLVTLFFKASSEKAPVVEAPPPDILSDIDLSEPKLSSEEESSLNLDLGETGPKADEDDPFGFDTTSEEPTSEEEKPPK